MATSRFPGFYKLSMRDRRERALREAGLVGSAGAVADASDVLDGGGLSLETADKMIENVLGTYALPFALGLNVQVNGKDYLVPMVVEEPSVVAAASNAAKMVRAGGGFVAEADPPLMIAQIELRAVGNPVRVIDIITRHRVELLQRGNDAVPNLVARGGGVRDLEIRSLGDGLMVLHLIVDCRDAMGANLVNTVAEQVSTRVADLTGATIGLRILSNLCDRRTVRVKVRVPVAALADDARAGEAVRDGIVAASRFAEHDPYRAATHNKGIMNGVDAVVLATGNDWRAVEAGAHAYAARRGRYEPLCTWSAGSNGALEGVLQMPLALGTVGGPARVHRGVQLALALSHVSGAQELAMLAASAGVASNLAALRALATDGIQAGHMALHARSVAVAAGATGSLVESVAEEIHRAGTITLDAAKHALRRILGGSPASAHV